MRLTDCDKLQLKLREYADRKATNGEIELANGILKAKCFIDQECEVIEENQLTNGWISVSERLPEKYGLYIVSVYYSDWICDYGTDDEVHKEPENIVLMAEYRKGMNGGHKWYLHEEDGETTINGNEKVYDKPDYWSTYIKAWQPLPEPYKEVSHD